MNKKLLTGLAAGLILIGIVGMAQAGLITTGTVHYDGADRNLIYDSDLNITWLDYTRDSATWTNQLAFTKRYIIPV